MTGKLTFLWVCFLLILACRVEEIAKKKGISMSQVALAWIMTKDPVAAPIVGTTKLENLADIISQYFRI